MLLYFGDIEDFIFQVGIRIQSATTAETMELCHSNLAKITQRHWGLLQCVCSFLKQLKCCLISNFFLGLMKFFVWSCSISYCQRFHWRVLPENVALICFNSGRKTRLTTQFVLPRYKFKVKSCTQQNKMPFICRIILQITIINFFGVEPQRKFQHLLPAKFLL